jgi:hypothetical protein
MTKQSSLSNKKRLAFLSVGTCSLDGGWGFGFGCGWCCCCCCYWSIAFLSSLVDDAEIELFLHSLIFSSHPLIIILIDIVQRPIRFIWESVSLLPLEESLGRWVFSRFERVCEARVGARLGFANGPAQDVPFFFGFVLGLLGRGVSIVAFLTLPYCIVFSVPSGHSFSVRQFGKHLEKKKQGELAESCLRASQSHGTLCTKENRF